MVRPVSLWSGVSFELLLVFGFAGLGLEVGCVLVYWVRVFSFCLLFLLSG